MYTVIRVLDEDSGVDLTPWVEAVNAAGVVPPLERMSRGRGYVADICDLPSWEDHLSALHACADGLRESSNDLKSGGASIVVDVALDADDRGRGGPFIDVGFPPDLLAALSAADIGLVVTFYPGSDPAL